MLQRRIGRVTYLVSGVLLFAIKSAIDFAVSKRFDHPYSLLFYVSPIDSPLYKPTEAIGYWLALWGVALPFITLGLFLTLRRLEDARLPKSLGLLFFVPFANLIFFAVCAVVPSREGASPSPQADRRNMSLLPAVFAAAGLGAVVSLGATAISVGVMKEYGAALLLGSPAISGFVSAYVVSRLTKPSFGTAVLSTTIAFALILGAMLAFFGEGMFCIAMALPLVAGSALLGALIGWNFGKTSPPLITAGAAMLLLPLTFGAERLSPLPMPAAAPVESEVIVNAPPEKVWKRVIAFPPLDEPLDGVFRFGIAAPLSATIDGVGPGAVRRCHFNTGDFVEPITVWRENEELSFDVTSTPDPMIEMTPVHLTRPPHLDGYLESTHGQFVLEPLPGGRTRLIGRTWYRTHMVPEAYWRLWADAIVHRIHLRVLDHVAKLAEAD